MLLREIQEFRKITSNHSTNSRDEDKGLENNGLREKEVRFGILKCILTTYGIWISTPTIVDTRTVRTH